MKKLGLTLVAALVFSVSAFAGDVKDNNASAGWDGSINKTQLSKYLRLTVSQGKEVGDICDFFEKEMSDANRSGNNKSEKVRNAVYGNLKLMKKTLDKEQYSNYVRLMAMTLRNKRIDLEVNK